MMKTAKKTKQKKLPDMSKWSDEQIADFWDAHDATAFIDDTDDVTGEVFLSTQPQKNASIRLSEGVLNLLKQIAKTKGLPGYSPLIRMWIYDKLKHHEV